MHPRSIKSRVALFFAVVGLAFVGGGADHGDTPLLISVNRHDARITDLFSFTRNGNLVLIVCTDPAVPPEVTDYLFPPDLSIEVFVDNDSEVAFDDPDDLSEHGGTIVAPHRIREDIVFRRGCTVTSVLSILASSRRGTLFEG